METPGRESHFGCGDTRKYLEKPFKHRVKVAPTTGTTLTRFLKDSSKYVQLLNHQNVDIALQFQFPVPIFKNIVWRTDKYRKFRPDQIFRDCFGSASIYVAFYGVFCTGPSKHVCSYYSVAWSTLGHFIYMANYGNKCSTVIRFLFILLGASSVNSISIVSPGFK